MKNPDNKQERKTQIFYRKDGTDDGGDSLVRLNLARLADKPLRAAKQTEEKTEKQSAFSRFAGIVLCGVVLLTVLFWLVAQNRASGVTTHSVVISEIMSQNVCAIASENGGFYDYIELCNTSQAEVNLHGMGLSDAAAGSARYVFEDVVLAPGETRVFFCEEQLPFSIKSSGGETVRLLDANGRVVASVKTLPMQENQAMVLEDGTYTVTDCISPGFENGAKGYVQYLSAKENQNPDLVISEVATRNVTLMGTSAQCVELQNISDAPIELSDYALSDDMNDLFRFLLPEGTLDAGETIVYTFGADDADAAFGFSSDESIILSNSRGVVQCEAPVCTMENITLVIDGDGYVQSDGVSLGFANDENGQAAYLAAHPIDGVVISEIVSNNRSVTVRGGLYDYVELYNAGDTAVNLSEYSISDDDKEPTLAMLPDVTLAAGEYIAFACDGTLSFDAYDPASGILPIGLSKSGESIGLYRNAEAVDYVSFPELGGNIAYGRVNLTHNFAQLAEATPAYANAAAAARRCAAPVPTRDGGVYEGVESITLDFQGEGIIHYTLDATEPDASDPIWEGPMELTETTVVRARCYVDGMAAGEIFTATYLINEGHTMDVACLVSEPGGLFSSSYGIYATGYNASPESPHFGANYWNRWEREAVVSFYGEDGSFSEPCGIRIFGGFSRSFSQKSLSVLFRDKYGAAELDFPLFGEDGLDSYEAFVFRSTGQDVFRAHMRDALMTTMYGDLLQQTTRQDSRPVVLYINGEYWGVYFIREKINEHFIAGNYNVDADTVSILFQKGYGNADFQEIVRFANSHDLSVQEHFDYVASRINLESYSNYLIAQMYSGNFDIGNVRYFSSPDYDNGRWNWILYDVDWTMSFEDTDSVRTMMSNNVVYSADLIRALLKNPEFKDWFLREFARQLNEVWSEEQVLSYLDVFVEELSPEMQRNCSRWGWRYSTWENQIEEIRSFAHNRPKNMYYHIKNYFGLTDAQMAEYGFIR